LNHVPTDLKIPVRVTLSETWYDLLHRPEFHDALDAGAIAHVSLNINLRLFTVGRRVERDDTEDARDDAFGDRLDDPALASAVAALEYDANLEPLGDDPELQLDQLGMQPLQFALTGFANQLVAGAAPSASRSFFGLL
jgi:hypothetical protein